MSVSIDLDPREVLEHLEALGYNHITKEQLKQFIKDLKKLIKYDIKKLQSHPQEDQENLSVDSEATQNSFRTANCRQPLREKNEAEKPLAEEIKWKPKSISIQTSVSTRDVSVSADSEVSTAPSSSSTGVAVKSKEAKGSASCCPCAGSAVPKTVGSKKENPPPKPVKSFIRSVPPDSRQGKCDPVTLYQYYQSLWARQNRPGENPHADVRWRVRHKMMGPVTAAKTNADRKRENPPWVD